MDDELVYDIGGVGMALMGVTMVCVVVVLVGTMVGFHVSTAAAGAAAFGIPACGWCWYRMEVLYPRHRAEALCRVAGDLGLAFQPSVPLDHVEELGRLTVLPRDTFTQGASNLLVGSYEGIPVRVLDHHVSISHGAESVMLTRTVVLVSDVRGLPEFRLIPRGPGDRAVHTFLARVGGPAAEGFSWHYKLHGEREAAVHASFDTNVVGFFAEHPGWHVSCDGRTLAIWRTEPGRAEATAHFRLTPQLDPGFRYVAPDSIPRLVSRAVAIRRLFHPAGSERGADGP